ncbi:MAG: helix-turn-helix domain-containing protein [Beijerinckiaceae bacterium]
MPDLYKQIGEQIRHLRITSPLGPLSQEALAEQLKVAPNTVSRWETATYKPTPEDLERLARHFRVSITHFFPDMKETDERVAALASATGGLTDKDFEEVLRYAEFRKARLRMRDTKPAKSKR